MNFLPDWAPNWHPLFIHFPIVLIIFAFLVDISKAIFKKVQWLSSMALILYIGGTIFALITYLTGKQAADSVSFPPEAYPVVSTHADYALYTIIFLIGYVVIRIFLSFKKWDTRNSIMGIMVLLGFVGVLFVQQTAELGGKLVYKYGVGTAPTKIAPPMEKSAWASTVYQPIYIEENGSWYWKAGIHTPESFQWIHSPKPTIYLSKDSLSAVLDVNSNQTNMAIFDPVLNGVQIQAVINLKEFNGRFYLIHHFKDTANYDFFAISEGMAKLGRKKEGKIHILSSKEFVEQGKIELKVVSSNGHFRGYVNNNLVVHGHANDLPPGKTGVAFSGQGKIPLYLLRVTSLESPERGQHHH